MNIDPIETMLIDDSEHLNKYIQENGIQRTQRAVVHHYFFMKYARFEFQMKLTYWMKLVKLLKYV
jgi:hypothetical protein